MYRMASFDTFNMQGSSRSMEEMVHLPRRMLMACRRFRADVSGDIPRLSAGVSFDGHATTKIVYLLKPGADCVTSSLYA